MVELNSLPLALHAGYNPYVNNQDALRGAELTPTPI